MADGADLFVEVDTFGGGGLEDAVSDHVVLSVGSRLDPMRKWEGIRSYDLRSGEATTFYGEPAPSGPMVRVSGRTLAVEGRFVESTGLGMDPDDPLVSVAIAATCREG